MKVIILEKKIFGKLRKILTIAFFFFISIVSRKLQMKFIPIHSNHFVYVPSQWETMLQCNVVSHWLGACTERPLFYFVCQALNILGKQDQQYDRWCHSSLTHWLLGDTRKQLENKFSHANFACSIWFIFSRIALQWMARNFSKHWFRFRPGPILASGLLAVKYHHQHVSFVAIFTKDLMSCIILSICNFGHACINS